MLESFRILFPALSDGFFKLLRPVTACFALLVRLFPRVFANPNAVLDAAKKTLLVIPGIFHKCFAATAGIRLKICPNNAGAFLKAFRTESFTLVPSLPIPRKASSAPFASWLILFKVADAWDPYLLTASA
ncbi:hypothetical protein [Lacrimispora sp. 210928-DFI.3.58]|uniref:hypothetical protein n=1 Tax=Lacrimispora sp. 210928-DFI.3.58 TaxID=2883214 RepID=UPI001D0846E2|nr:hypothetical protein [Lacrimispora sp. 210928-DFI.3.58]